FQGIHHPQKGGDGDDLGSVQLYSNSFRISRGQSPTSRGVVKRLAVVKGHGSFDRLDGVVVEKWACVCGFHQGRRVEGTITWFPKSIVRGNQFARKVSWLVWQILDAGIEIGVSDVPSSEVRRGAGVRMAEVALAERVVQEDLLPALGDDAFERQGQRHVLLSSQRKLEGFQGVQFLSGR